MTPPVKRREPEQRGWPHYLLRGRVRTSTATLMVAFIALFWVNYNYQPTLPAAVDPSQQVVPPGFVPDPNYTWVPRTNVQTREPEYTTTTPRTTTTTTSPTPTTSPTSPQTTTSGPSEPGQTSEPPTTVVDPDGPGPLGPQTFTEVPPTLTPTTVLPPGATPTPTPTPTQPSP